MKSILPYTFALLFALTLVSGCRSESASPKAATPPPTVLAGLRASPYGAGDLFRNAEYWIRSSQNFSSRVHGAAPAVIWILGTMESSAEKQPSSEPIFTGRTVLNFPSDGQDHPHIVFTESDENEQILQRFNQAGISVWLQVEPANAEIPTLIDLILSRYSHHPCVIGFGVDVEWHRWSPDHKEGVAVADEDARAWLSAVWAHSPDYRLFLKHWRIDMMPATVRQGIMFLDDSQMFSSLTHMLEEFSTWGKHFAPADVGFQYGYGPDRFIWNTFTAPASDLAKLFKQIANAREFYWVDFTMRELWP